MRLGRGLNARGCVLRVGRAWSWGCGNRERRGWGWAAGVSIKSARRRGTGDRESEVASGDPMHSPDATPQAGPGDRAGLPGPGAAPAPTLGGRDLATCSTAVRSRRHQNHGSAPRLADRPSGPLCGDRMAKGPLVGGQAGDGATRPNNCVCDRLRQIEDGFRPPSAAGHGHRRRHRGPHACTRRAVRRHGRGLRPRMSRAGPAPRRWRP